MATKTLRADSAFKAFSDLTRLRIMILLSKGEICVGDMVSILKVPQPTASRHLAYLRRAGLVATRKQDRWIFYALAPAKTPFQKALFNCLECCFDELPQIQKDQQRSKLLKREGGCC